MSHTNYQIMVPHDLRAEGNNFMGVTGMSMGDTNTFQPNARYWRADNHSLTYHVCNMYDDYGFEQKIAAPLVRPEYDTEEVLDVEGAQTLLDNASQIPPYDEEGVPLAAPTQMVIAKLGGWQQLISIYGIEQIPED